MNKITLSPQNNALSLLKANTSNLFQNNTKQPSVGSTSQTNALLAELEKSDPEKAKAFQKKLEDSQNLLKQLTASQSDFSEQRKAEAARKLAEVKEKLKALRLLASINPEAAARQAKQIARELKQAVQEYSNASGGNLSTATPGNLGVENVDATASTETLTDPAAATVPSTEANITTTDPTDTATVDQQTTRPQSKTSQTNESDSDTSPQAQQATQAETEARTELTKIEDDIEKEQDDTPPSVREQVQAQIAQIKQSFAASKEDKDFANAAQEIKNTLKSIIETIKRQLQNKNSAATHQDVQDASNDLKEIDKALSNISSGSLSTPLGDVSIVNILA